MASTRKNKGEVKMERFQKKEVSELTIGTYFGEIFKEDSIDLRSEFLRHFGTGAVRGSGWGVRSRLFIFSFVFG